MAIKKTLAPQPKRGVTAVEFSLVAPIVLLTIFAGVEFVRTNVIRHTVQNASYAASRAVMVPGASKSEAIAEANSLLSLVGITDAQIVFEPSTITEETRFVTTRISIPMAANSWGLSELFGDGILVGESVLRTERAPNVQAQALPTMVSTSEPPEEPLDDEPIDDLGDLADEAPVEERSRGREPEVVEI